MTLNQAITEGDQAGLVEACEPIIAQAINISLSRKPYLSEEYLREIAVDWLHEKADIVSQKTFTNAHGWFLTGMLHAFREATTA